MEKLVVKFECLDGYYNLSVLDNHCFVVDTNIECLQSNSGLIEDYDEFVNKLNKINIKSWDSENDDTTIEDGVKWSVALDDYVSRGIEGDWPYNYDALIDVLMDIDDKIIYFKANLV